MACGRARSEPSAPWMPSHWNANGTLTTTMNTRRLCAEATLSISAPWRAARLAISLALPIAPEYHAVGRSTTPKRYSTNALIVPRVSAKTMQPRIAGAWVMSSIATSGMKYSPTEVPMHHWPARRIHG